MRWKSLEDTVLSRRFIRNYELMITLTTGEVVKIIPELRIAFEVQKSINLGLNTCKMMIYNLSQEKIKKIIRDKEDWEKIMKFALSIGYGNELKLLYSGSVSTAKTEKKGTDFITTIDSEDGGFDYQNSFTSKVVSGNEVDAVLQDMPNTTKGKVSERLEYKRPKILVGSSAKILEDCLKDDETLFIDDGKLNIIKRNEVVSNYIPVVNYETGLIKSPTRTNQQVNFQTMMNPELKVGGLCNLISLYQPHLDGVYKIESIKSKGDNYGSDWSQEVVCMKVTNYKAL